MIYFNLAEMLKMTEGMPPTYCLLSDTSRIIILSLLSRAERWQWLSEEGGEKLSNEQWDVAQAMVELAEKEVIFTMLTGSIIIWARYDGQPPDGFLVCDGSEISRTEYANLFEVIGTAYGEGDFETTFNLPRFQRRFPMGWGIETGPDIGESGGAETHTLSIAEMPTHPGHQSVPALVVGPGEIPVETVPISYGDDQPHNNMPPWLAVAFIIKF